MVQLKEIFVVLYLGDVSLSSRIEGEVDLCIICVTTESDVVFLDIFSLQEHVPFE